MTVKIKRIYEDSSAEDGLRILVDRVWPRGISKERAGLDYWLKEIGPSKELRQWFNHEDDKYEDFSKRYREELSSGEAKEDFDKLKELARGQDVSLIYSAKNEKHNQAQVLKDLLEEN